MSSDTRRQLLNSVTDLFLLDQDPTALAQDHYGHIALHSLPHLSEDDRRSYAENVAATPTLPHEVAVKLAGDADADVARLVLSLSPVLTDGDLAAIAVSQSQRHLAAIAERTQLSEDLTDILVERGDRQVLTTVSSNEGARLSDRGFDKLVERSGGDAEIGLNISTRSDTTPDRAERMMQIVERLNADGGLWGSPGDAAATLAREARQQRLEVKLLMADLAAGKRTVEDVLTMLADEDRAYHLAQVLAQVSGITPEQALRVLMQRDMSGIAVTCRSLDIGPDGFRAILNLRMRRLYFVSRKIDDDLDAYLKLDNATAERTLRFLKLKVKLA